MEKKITRRSKKQIAGIFENGKEFRLFSDDRSHKAQYPNGWKMKREEAKKYFENISHAEMYKTGETIYEIKYSGTKIIITV